MHLYIAIIDAKYKFIAVPLPYEFLEATMRAGFRPMI
jgi:hypothetical protein